MRVISLNLNGIRSAATKGVFPWLERQKADIVCLQELKAQIPDIGAEMLAPANLTGAFHPAEKKGYSGVGLYFRRNPMQIREGLGLPHIDAEGRFLRADFDQLSVISLYLVDPAKTPQCRRRKGLRLKCLA